MKESQGLGSARPPVSARKTLSLRLLLILFCLSVSPASREVTVLAQNPCFYNCQQELFDCMKQETQPMCEDAYNTCVQSCL